MKVFDINDIEIDEESCDLELGRLVQDFVNVAYHEAVPPKGEVGHTRVTVTFTDDTQYVTDCGGYPTQYFDDQLQWIVQEDGEYAGKEARSIDSEYVVDEPYEPGKEAWYENEPILRYIPYTEQELIDIAEEKRRVELELAEELRRQKEYEDTIEAVKDLLLVQAELIGA